MYILLVKYTDNSIEKRIVSGDSIESLSPMLNEGFLPVDYDGENDDELEELIKDSIVVDSSELYGELVDHLNFMESYKNTENVIKGIYDPTQVFILYKEQVKYGEYAIWDFEEEDS